MPNLAEDSTYSRGAARPANISRGLETVQDLLDRIAASEGPKAKPLAMLRTTAMHVSRCLGRPLGATRIHELVSSSPEINAYLRSRGFKRNTVRSYGNYLRILVQEARALGWEAWDPRIEAAWAPFLAAQPRGKRDLSRARMVIKYAISNGIRPEDFGELHLNAWEEWMVRRGRSHSWIKAVKRYFSRIVFTAGLQTALREPHLEGGAIYRTRYDQLPNPLRSQLEELLEWKVADISEGRPARCRHRPVTAKHLRNTLCRIFGFGHNIRGKDIRTLDELVSRISTRMDTVVRKQTTCSSLQLSQFLKDIALDG